MGPRCHPEVLRSNPSFTTHRRGPDEGHDWDAPDLSQDFHTFAVNWQADHIAWYVDGVERARTTRPALICREAMYPILNLAVGDAAGPPDETAFPETMEVDYVRMWRNP